MEHGIDGQWVVHVGSLPGLPKGVDLTSRDSFNIAVSWGPVVLLPTHQVLYFRQGGGGENDPLPGHVVHWVVHVTEVTHGVHVAKTDHHLTIVVRGEVLVPDLHVPVPTAADNAGPDPPAEAPHLVGHLHAIVRAGGHLDQLLLHGKYLPTGQKT